MLKRLEVEKALIVDDNNLHLERSARNVYQVKVIRPEGLNVYDILRYEHILIAKNCLEKIEERLKQ